MLSAQDCLDYINLTQQELEIINRKENLSSIMAIKKCSCLLDNPEGVLYLHSIFLDEFNKSYEKGDFDSANECMNSYRGFSEKYPLPTYLSSR